VAVIHGKEFTDTAGASPPLLPSLPANTPVPIRRGSACVLVARASTLDAMRASDVTIMLPAQDFVETALLAKVSVSHDTRVFTFATPDPTKPLGLTTCACILASSG